MVSATTNCAPRKPGARSRNSAIAAASCAEVGSCRRMHATSTLRQRSRAGRGTARSRCTSHGLVTWAPSNSVDNRRSDQWANVKGHRQAVLCHQPGPRRSARTHRADLPVTGTGRNRRARTSSLHAQLIATPARLAHSAHRQVLHLLRDWPYEAGLDELLRQALHDPLPAAN